MKWAKCLIIFLSCYVLTSWAAIGVTQLKKTPTEQPAPLSQPTQSEQSPHKHHVHKSEKNKNTGFHKTKVKKTKVPDNIQSIDVLDFNISTTAAARADKLALPLPPAKVKADNNSVALTFDDGPDPRFTPKILDILDKYKIKATFFVVGENARLYPHLIEEIQRRGHHLGNHSMTHPFLTHLPDSEVIFQIDKDSDVISEITKVKPVCFRPPYGAHNRKIDRIANRDGMHVILWNVDSEDYKKPGINKVVSNVLKETRPGYIILFHDGGGNRSQTVQALPIIIETLRSRGIQFQQLC